MTLALLVLAVLALSFANGANDNFKGVAPLFGNGTLGIRKALALGTVATLAGSIVSVALARDLALAFSGKGLVPDALSGAPAFLGSVALAGAVAILAATRLGLPTSTTHALTGALFGTSFLAKGGSSGAGVLWASFLKPLLVSPIVAAALAGLGCRLFARRARSAASRCLCVGSVHTCGAAAGGIALRSVPSLEVTVGGEASCEMERAGALRITGRNLLDGLHVLGGASVCFARAVNDTPKIAVLWIAAWPSASGPLAACALAMALGGLLAARRVAETMSLRITPLSREQGLVASLVTAATVLFASRLGMPVSTTHVSCGAIMGAGATAKSSDGRVIGRILLAWAVTLPLGALLGAGFYAVLSAAE
ncbi:MAG: hypothetical protein Fur0037_08480 [Planctomycetota bacterium]